MSESFTPTATAPTFPMTLPLDGEIINHANLIDTMVKGGLNYTASAIATATANTAALAQQTASSGDTLIGVLTYVGSFLTLPTGTLRTVLQYIANNVARGPTSANIAPGVGVVIDSSHASYVWATPSANQDVDVSATTTVPRPGATIWVTRPATGAFGISLHRVGEAGALVTLTASTECGALLVWVGDGAGVGRWRLAWSTTGATPGADA